MSATKTLTPPPKRNPLGRRGRGTGTLVLYVDRDAAGRPVPYGMNGKAPLWKFVFRYRGRARNLACRDWPDAVNEAAKVRAEFDAPAATTTPTVAAPSAITVAALVADFLDRLRARGSARPATVEGYRRELARHVLDLPTRGGDRTPFGARAAVEVTRADVAALVFKDGKSRFTSQRTHNKAVTLLRSVFEFGVALHDLPANPVVGALHRVSDKQVRRRAKRARTKLTGEQLDAVVTAALAHEDPRVGLAAILAGYGGLRLRELTHLRVRDVTVTDALVDVHVDTDYACRCGDCAANGGRRMTKTDLDRFVPLLPAQGARLRQQVDRLAALGLTGKDVPLLAVVERRPRSRQRHGSWTPADWLATEVRRVVEVTLGTKLQPRERLHLLRAAARVRLAHAGLSTEQIDLILGHELEGARAAYSYEDRAKLFGALCGAFGAAPRPRIVRRSA